MNAIAKKLALAFGILAFVSSCTATSNSSTQTQQSPNVTQVSDSAKLREIKIDGSSTVYPITQAIAKEFKADAKNNAQVQVNFSGTSGGFEKFCAGETDISNASRPILKEEMEACNKNGVRYYEFPIAFDAVLPSREAVEKVQYQPLSRPLFIYANFESAQKKSAVKDFINFYIKKAPTIVSSV
ncbi:MAG: substrate-binding domain-containing protein, partial [Nostoc sp. C3-bin3]|nr:substrate-binding domain-containing protein [Nostoc sp. C3-bin3]